MKFGDINATEIFVGLIMPPPPHTHVDAAGALRLVVDEKIVVVLALFDFVCEGIEEL